MRAWMGVVIVGGQSLCLGITLLVTPVAYSLFDDVQSFFTRILTRKLNLN
jgi:hypothetical protein